MASHTQHFGPQFRHADWRSGFAGLRERFDAWWMALPQVLRSPAWPWTLAVLMVLFLLLAFHQVVRDAVRQGELMRMATASHSEAVWRCGALRGLRMRESCLAQLNAAPHEEPAPEVRNVATLASVGR
jgi:hypothetical protein